jgi:hypothetical protein
MVPASLPKAIKLSEETTLILEAISALSDRIMSLEHTQPKSTEDSNRLRGPSLRTDELIKAIERLWLLNTEQAEEEIAILEKRLM